MSYREGHFYVANDEVVSPQHHVTMVEPLNIDEHSFEDLAALWHKTVKAGMHGICFSMYEEGQEPGDVITREQVMRRMKILEPHIKWVRSFSCIEGNEHVPSVAKELGIRTLVGAWLGDDEKKNELEIEALIKLAKDGLVDIAAVGNEVLYRNDLSLEELVAYIDRVKTVIPHIPVGYVDAYYEFSRHPILVEKSDVILTNCYPFWEGCPIEYSLGHMNSMFHQVLAACQGKKVIITETGWPNQGESLKGSHPSDENAMKYFIDTQLWCKENNIESFYFSSFDEDWKKSDEGEVGAFWGLWNSKEQLKY